MLRSLFSWRLLLSIALVTLIIASAACTATVSVRFLSQGTFVYAEREVPADMAPAEAAARALVAGPTDIEKALGYTSSIPAGTAVNYVAVNNDVVEVDMSAQAVAGLTEAGLAAIFDQFRTTMSDFTEVMMVKLTSGGKPLASFLAPGPVVGSAPRLPGGVQTSGVGLAGKKVAVGPSHGKFWNGDAWYWQRTITCGWGEEGALEDTNSIKLVTFLRQYLTQDGATFITPRALDDICGNNPDTGLPWTKMCAQSWLHNAGADCSIWANSSGNCGADAIAGLNRSSDDIRARPLWADFNNADIYIAHHTNAGGGGTATGTETFRDTLMEHPEWVAASLTLATQVQNNIVDAIRTTFDEEPSWASRGVKDSAAGFGEIRIPSRPACLVELAFHDNCTRDALYLIDDFFRSVSEWGIYKGVCAYFGNTPTWDKYSCEFVSDTIPTTMNPGQVYNVSVTLLNRGVCWLSTRGFKLAATANNDPWFKSVSSVSVPALIKPGETCTLNFQLTGPIVGGVRTTEWRMARTGFSSGFGPTITRVVDAGTVVDIDPPTVPQNLRMTGRTTASISLEWDASTDAITEVSGYNLYRDGIKIATVTSGTTFTDTGRTQNTTYTYEVEAYDAFNNTSAKSDPLVASTLPDAEPPTVPQNLHTTAVTAANVALAWDASTDNIGVTGYTIYRNGASIATTAATTYNDTTVAQSTSYTYEVDAYDLAGNHSEKSNTVAVDTPVSATWGPFNCTQSQSIYYPSNYATSLRTGWYTTTAGTGASRIVTKPTDANLTTMPAQSMCTGGRFTIAFTRAGTYSTSANNPVNIFRLTRSWTYGATTIWNSPWTTAGGDYASVGTAAQDNIYPAEGTVYTFNPSGTNAWFPYGVMVKGNVESSISYRKAWLGSGPYPTLAVYYTPPTPTIRSWAYLGHYAQGVAADHVTRINTDHVSGTYNGIAVTEANIAPGATDGVSGPDFGNSYGAFKWKTGTVPNDVVNLLLAPFYNSAAKDNGTTYAACYVYRSTATSNVYMGIGSDDDVKVYVNGTLVGSYVGASGRGAVGDQDFYGPFSLPSGWSRLLVKVENGSGGYGLYARFANVDRTAVAGITTYTSDATAPTNPTGCTEAGGALNDTWQDTVVAPSFSWTGAADPQGSGEGVSGIRGYKVYFGSDPAGVPATFQTAAMLAPGAQEPGIYYLRVSTVDYALNESAAATLFVFKYLGIPPVTTATPAGGVYKETQNVVLSAPGAAAIYYTTDGSEPTTSSSVYSAPIAVSDDTTLRFFAVGPAGAVESPAKQEIYAILMGDGSIAEARAASIGADVRLGDKALYLKNGSFGYIEEADRIHGIRIEGTISADEGQLVCLVGSRAVTPDGEPCVAVSQMTPGGPATIEPWATNGKSFQYSLLDGLFVTAWGMVKPGSVTSNSYVLVMGSADMEITVMTKTTPTFTGGEFVIVSGAVGFGTVRVIYEK